MKEELLENMQEFLESGEDNLKKKRYNASITDFFKSIVIGCDFLLYNEIKILPKNHNERFLLIKKYFPDIYFKLSKLFKIYTRSYNFKSELNEVLEIKNYAYDIKRFAENKT